MKHNAEEYNIDFKKGFKIIGIACVIIIAAIINISLTVLAAFYFSVNTNGILKGTGTVAGAFAFGYITYRVIRMIPSLFPPLWWTIPANAAAP